MQAFIQYKHAHIVSYAIHIQNTHNDKIVERERDVCFLRYLLTSAYLYPCVATSFSNFVSMGSNSTVAWNVGEKHLLRFLSSRCGAGRP